MTGFWDGFGSFFRGIGLLFRTPRLWPFALAPFFIGFAVLIWGFVWGAGNIAVLVEGVIHSLDFLKGVSYSIAYWVVLILTWPAFLFALFYGVFLATRLIAAPFHALLAERSLIALGTLRDEPFQLRVWLAVSMRMFLVSLVKTLLFGGIGLLLFGLSFIPGLNIASAFGFLLIVAFDCTDYSFEAMRMGFRERLRFFKANFAGFSGLAAALGLVFFIPGFNFFLFPAAVVGGSDLYSRLHPKRSPSGVQPTSVTQR